MEALKDGTMVSSKTAEKTSKKVPETKIEDDRVPVFLIKSKEKKDDFFCAINGTSYQIKRGEMVMVPKAVEEIIRHQNQMDQIALENLEKATRKFAE